jgi:GTPase SAR1 family protein
MNASFVQSEVPGVSSAKWASRRPTSYKAIVIGPSAVGKTSLCRCMARVNDAILCAEDATLPPEATIGLDFTILSYRHEQRKFTLQLWDTAGQERFAPIVKKYYRGCTVVFVVLDTPCLLASVRKTHCNAANVCLPSTHWDAKYERLDAAAIVQAELDKYLCSFKQLTAPADAAAFVVLNKSDALAHDKEALTMLLDLCATASKSHADFAAFRCFATSALNGDGVIRLYEATKSVASAIIETKESASAATAAVVSAAKPMNLSSTQPQQGCGC